MEQIRIVLADFDQDSRESMAEGLASMEDMVVTAQTDEADRVLELLKATDAQVLVLEMSLRGGDGLEVLEQVKGELEEQVQVLVCSHFADQTLVSSAVKRGAAYYMIKPVSIPALAEHIRLACLEEAGWEEHSSLRYRLTMLLRQLGGLPNMKGYNYTIEAVIIVLEDPDAVCGITKVVYPQIARRHRSTSSAVERSIRHMINKLWENGNQELLRQLFPTVKKGKRGPSNGAFIAVLAQQIRERQRKWG